MIMKEYRINDYIKLKLENEKTVIYVDGKRFWHRKALIFNVPIEEVTEFENINSIDELIEEIDAIPEEYKKRYLTPEGLRT